MKALTNADRVETAIELYQQAVGAHGLAPNGTVLMRLCIAARKAGRDAAARAVAHVQDLLASGVGALHEEATDAYVHCCATAVSPQPALDVFLRALDARDSARSKDGRSDARAAGGARSERAAH